MDQKLSPTSRFLLRKESVAWQSLDTESVLVQLEREEVHVANPMAAVLVEALQTGATLPELVERVTRDYEVGAEQVAADIEAFLLGALEAGLVAEEPAK